jgi:transcriptional regulator with XRE-family HTH domain
MSGICSCIAPAYRYLFDKKNFMKTGQLIRELRLKKGITQEELAAKTDISVRTIQRIESGDVDARAFTLQSIAAALEVDYEVLVNVETDLADG